MDDLGLRDALRPLARSLIRADRELRAGAIRDSFDNAGNIKASAMRNALPPAWITWYIAGSLSAANNVGEEFELPAPARLTNLVVRVKTAPSGTCTLRLTVNGSTLATVTVPIGQTRGRVAIPADDAVRSAGDVLRVDVVSAGGAANATVMAAYTVGD